MMAKNKCFDCKYARQAGDKTRSDVVGCVLSTHNDRLSKSFTGTQYHEGYWHTCYPGDTKYAGSIVYGILVDSEESCKNFVGAVNDYDTRKML